MDLFVEINFWIKFSQADGGAFPFLTSRTTIIIHIYEKYLQEKKTESGRDKSLMEMCNEKSVQKVRVPRTFLAS